VQVPVEIHERDVLRSREQQAVPARAARAHEQVPVVDAQADVAEGRLDEPSIASTRHASATSPRSAAWETVMALSPPVHRATASYASTTRPPAAAAASFS
jgi:hypothetical protein